MAEALVLHNFQPENADELEASRGDRIQILTRVNNDWLMAQKGHTIGLIPSNFVSFLPQQASSHETGPANPPISGLPPSPSAITINNWYDPEDLPPSPGTPPPLPFGFPRVLQENLLNLRSPHAVEDFQALELNSRVPSIGGSSHCSKCGFLNVILLNSDIYPELSRWKECWCTFDGDDFRIFSSQSDSDEILCLSKSSFRRFEVFGVDKDSSSLPTYEIEISFDGMVKKMLLSSSDGVVNLESWIDLLFSAGKRRTATLMSSLKLTPVGNAESPPLHQGWLKKFNRSFKDWKKRYVVLKDGYLCYYKSSPMLSYHEPTQRVDTVTCSIKSDTESPWNFEIITPKRKFVFHASSAADADTWIRVVQAHIEWRIGQLSPAQTSFKALNRKEACHSSQLIEGGPVVLSHVHSLIGNSTCADCGMSDADWASINLGVVICIECSGVHRSLGVHISKVRSLRLDEWEAGVLEILSCVGNVLSNSIFERTLPSLVKPLPGSSRESKELYIREKYIDRKFIDRAGFSEVVASNDPAALSLALLKKCLCDDSSCIPECLALLVFGADINLRYDRLFDGAAFEEIGNGYTALHCASRKGNIPLVYWLLLNGASSHVKDDNNCLPVDVALDDDVRSIIKRAEGNSSDNPSQLTFIHGVETKSDTDFRETNIRLQSWLVKANGQDGSKGWNKRFFLFESYEEDYYRSGSIMYYTSDKLKEERGTIPLADFLDVRPGSAPVIGLHDSWKYVFELHTWSRVYILAAENKFDFDRWMGFLNDVKNHHRGIDTSVVKDDFVISTQVSGLDQTMSRVFGIDLSSCAERRQGSRDRGIPLFLSKTVGYFHQLLGMIPPKDVKNAIQQSYSRYTDGFSQAGVLGLVKHLKQRFDNDDEGLDFGAELNAWIVKSACDDDNTARITFLRGITLLMLHYLSSLPKPLIMPSFFDQFTEVIGHLRNLSISAAFASPRNSMISSSPLSGADVISAVPSHLLSRLVVPGIRQLPEANYQTLRKIAGHLHKILSLCGDCSEVSYLKLRREVAITWATPSFGLSTLDTYQKQKKPHDNRIFFIELLIEHYEVLFGGAKSDCIISSPSGKHPEESPEVFPIDVYVGDTESQVVSKRISISWSAKELIAELVSHLVLEDSSVTTETFAFYALHEVLPPGMERAMPLKEIIFDVTQSWQSPAGHRIVFKYSRIKELLSSSRSGALLTPSNQLPSPYTMKGWLHKEGVSVKSWKERFFIIRHDYIYYFRDNNCAVQNLVGKLSYRNYGVYICRRSEASPSPFQFCIRHIPYKLKQRPGAKIVPPRYLCADSEEALYSWVLAIMRASQAGDPEKTQLRVQKLMMEKQISDLALLNDLLPDSSSTTSNGDSRISTPCLAVTSFSESSPIGSSTSTADSSVATVEASPLSLAVQQQFLDGLKSKPKLPSSSRLNQ